VQSKGHEEGATDNRIVNEIYFVINLQQTHYDYDTVKNLHSKYRTQCN